MNRYKYLVASGCSFIEGQSLSPYHDRTKIRNTEGILTAREKEQLRFTKKLSEKLTCQEVNIGSSGSSNERSIRVIYEWIQENKDKVRDTLFVIGLTELLRSEKFSSQTQSYIKWRPTTFYQNLNEISSDINSSEKFMPGSFKFANFITENGYKEDLKKYLETEITLFIDLQYEFKKLSRKLDMLDSYIKQKGGRLITFAAMLELDNEVKNVNGIVGELESIDAEIFTFPGGYKSWRPYIKSYDNLYSYSYHPSIVDDAKLADLFYEYLDRE